MERKPGVGVSSSENRRVILERVTRRDPRLDQIGALTSPTGWSIGCPGGVCNIRLWIFD